jgi:hypothetical protein
MIKIPKRFKLFAATINVTFDNEACDKAGAYGKFYHDTLKIILQDKSFGSSLSEDRIKDVFYHEKVHAILEAMNEEDLNKNEKFVDVFAKLLRQSDETAEYDSKVK